MERRAGGRDGIVREIMLRGLAHGGDDIVHPVGEDGEILLFRLEKLLVEHAAGIAEHAAAERLHIAGGDAPAEPAGQHLPAVEFEIGAAFEVAAGDEVGGLALGRGHPAPDFRHEQADVVIHPVARADPTGGG